MLSAAILRWFQPKITHVLVCKPSNSYCMVQYWTVLSVSSMQSLQKYQTQVLIFLSCSTETTGRRRPNSNTMLKLSYIQIYLQPEERLMYSQMLISQCDHLNQICPGCLSLHKDPPVWYFAVMTTKSWKQIKFSSWYNFVPIMSSLN